MHAGVGTKERNRRTPCGRKLERACKSVLELLELREAACHEELGQQPDRLCRQRAGPLDRCIDGEVDATAWCTMRIAYCVLRSA